eukprot:5318317-Prymnesium_polylepis.1
MRELIKQRHHRIGARRPLHARAQLARRHIRLHLQMEGRAHAGSRGRGELMRVGAWDSGRGRAHAGRGGAAGGVAAVVG